VSVFENTDIRNFSDNKIYDVIVGDVSFISLEKILAKVISFGGPGSHFFLLIKPQFEVGKGNTKKGIVKDSDMVKVILDNYMQLVNDKSAKNSNISACVVPGGDGNQEFFLTFSL
jgi:23S rRNA (cytidine1920-2'-O)/16S rRNA (cytidine1409-2'-O)-methyltransferase